MHQHLCPGAFEFPAERGFSVIFASKTCTVLSQAPEGISSFEGAPFGFGWLFAFSKLSRHSS